MSSVEKVKTIIDWPIQIPEVRMLVRRSSLHKWGNRDGSSGDRRTSRITFLSIVTISLAPLDKLGHEPVYIRTGADWTVYPPSVPRTIHHVLTDNGPTTSVSDVAPCSGFEVGDTLLGRDSPAFWGHHLVIFNLVPLSSHPERIKSQLNCN